MPALSARVSRPTASEEWVSPKTCQLAAVTATALPALETNRPANSQRKSRLSRSGATSMTICPTRIPALSPLLLPAQAGYAGYLPNGN